MELLRKIFVLVVALVVVVAAAIGFVETSAGKRFLARRLEKLADQNLNGSLSIGAIRGNFIRHLTLQDVLVRDAKGRTVFSAANIVIDLRLKRAKPIRVAIERLQVEQPRLTVYATPPGLGELAKSQHDAAPPEAEEESGLLSNHGFVTLRELRVADGRVTVESLAKKPSIIDPIQVALELPRPLDRLPLGTVLARGIWEGLRVRLETSSSDALGDAGASRLSAVAKGAPIQRLTIAAEVEKRGSLAVAATLARAESAEVRGHFNKDAGARIVGVERFALRGRSCLLLAPPQDKTADIQELRVEQGDALPFGRLRLSGCAGDLSYERDRERLRARVDRLNLHEIFAALGGAETPLGKSLGVLRASVELPRGPGYAEGHVDALWDKVRLIPERPARLRLVADIDGGDLRSTLDAKIGKQKIAGDVAVRRLFQGTEWLITPERASGRARFAANAVEASKGMAKLDLKLDARYEPNELKAELTAGFTGEKRAALAANARAALDQARLRREGVAALQEAPLHWALKAARFEISRLVPQQPGLQGAAPALFADLAVDGLGTATLPVFKATASLSTVQGKLLDAIADFGAQRIDARLSATRGRVDSLIQLASNDLRTEGAYLDSDLWLRGPRAKPTYGGRASLRADKLRLPAYALEYRDLAIDLAGGQQELRLARLFARGGSGTLDGRGRLLLDESSQALDFQAALKNFGALDDGKLKVEASGDLTLTANRSDASFRGKLEVSEGKVSLPDLSEKGDLEPLEPLADVVMKSELEEKRRAAESPGLLDRLHGQIDVHVPGHFWVVGPDLKIELRAALQAGLDEASETFVTGHVETVRGSAELLGRRFELRHGTVEFTGDPENPRLNNVEAVYQASPYAIVVALNGPVDKLKPQIFSEPSGLSEDQAVGVLLTGSPDYRTGGGPPRSAGSIASGAASGFVVGKLKQKLGPALPFDTFTADLATTDQAAASGHRPSGDNETGRSKIEVGKYLSDRLFVKLGHVVGAGDNEALNRLTLDYRLSERWSLQTTQTDRGRSDLGVIWTLNY